MHAAAVNAISPEPQTPTESDTGPGAQATTATSTAGGNPPGGANARQCYARIIIDVYPDEITEIVNMVMGDHHDTVGRYWRRVGEGSFKTRDPDWATHEDRVGVEVVDFMTSIDLPTRIARMLPRKRGNPNAAAEAAALLDSTGGRDDA